MAIFSIGPNIAWIITNNFKIPKPNEKYNLRMNTIYEEFHSNIQKEILNKLFKKIQIQ